jgi:predicted porin
MENEDGDDVCGVPTDHFWGVRIPVSVTAPDVVAKITDGNMYVQLQTEAGFAADYVAEIEEDDAAEYSAPDVAGSLTFGGAFAPATVAIEFATAGDYEADAHVDGMVLGATIGLDVAPLTIDFAIATGVGYAADQDLGLALQVAADVAPLSITAAFDGINNAAGFDYELSANIGAAIDPITVGLDVFYKDDLDLSVSVGAAVGALGATLTADVLNVIDALGWEIALDLTYAVSEDVAAAAGFSVDDAEVMAAYANVVMTGLVDNVTFTLGWEEGDDLGNDNLGQIIFATNIAY